MNPNKRKAKVDRESYEYDDFQAQYDKIYDYGDEYEDGYDDDDEYEYVDRYEVRRVAPYRGYDI